MGKRQLESGLDLLKEDRTQWILRLATTTKTIYTALGLLGGICLAAYELADKLVPVKSTIQQGWSQFAKETHALLKDSTHFALLGNAAFKDGDLRSAKKYYDIAIDTVCTENLI
jgi:hypothetical protein